MTNRLNIYSSFQESKGLIVFCVAWLQPFAVKANSCLGRFTPPMSISCVNTESVSFLPVDLCRVILRNSFLPLPPPLAERFFVFELPGFYCISKTDLRPKNDFSINVTVAVEKKTEFSLVCNWQYFKSGRPSTLMMSMERDFILSLRK